MSEPEYEPYGPEWRKEMFKLAKGQIIDMLRTACMENRSAPEGEVWRDVDKAWQEYAATTAVNNGMEIGFRAGWQRRALTVPQESEQLLEEAQDAIRNKVIQESGAPDYKIDGAGCDSGDPLDLTLAEIGQGFSWLKDLHDEQLRLAREALEWTAKEHEMFGWGYEECHKAVNAALSALGAKV